MIPLSHKIGGRKNIVNNNTNNNNSESSKQRRKVSLSFAQVGCA